MRKELVKRKEELLSEHWTENLHYGLKDMKNEDAKEIVESMDDDDIYRKVNFKRFQQDYIADYLEYLWDLSQNSFWKHIESLFKDKEELLMSDNMFYFDKMCNERIPSSILKEVINYIKDYKRDDDSMNEYRLLSDIVLMQVNNFQRIDEINNIIAIYSEKEQKEMKIKFTKILASSTTFL